MSRNKLLGVMVNERDSMHIEEAANRLGVSMSTLAYAAMYESTLAFTDFSRLRVERFAESRRQRRPKAPQPELSQG